MAFEWQRAQAFHARFKNKTDARVQTAYETLLDIMSHASSDRVVAKWLGVSRRTVGRWRDTGFSSTILDERYDDILAVQRYVQQRLDEALREVGPGAIVETRQVRFYRPTIPESKQPGSVHVLVSGAPIEKIFSIMEHYQALRYSPRKPVYQSFYFTMKFGSKFQGKWWNGEEIKDKPSSKDESGVWIEGGQQYNTKLTPLHEGDAPPKGDNLNLYGHLTDNFYTLDTKIIRVVFQEFKRKP